MKNKKVTLKKMNVGDVIKLKNHEHTILRSNVIFNDEGTIVKIEKNESNQVEYVHVKLKNKNEWLYEWNNCLIFDNQDVDSQSVETQFEIINHVDYSIADKFNDLLFNPENNKGAK